MNKEMRDFQDKVRKLIIAGTRLSNIAYNLSNKVAKLDKRTIELLLADVREWDAAVNYVGLKP